MLFQCSLTYLQHISTSLICHNCYWICVYVCTGVSVYERQHILCVCVCVSLCVKVCVRCNHWHATLTICIWMFSNFVVGFVWFTCAHSHIQTKWIQWFFDRVHHLMIRFLFHSNRFVVNFFSSVSIWFQLNLVLIAYAFFPPINEHIVLTKSTV